MSDNSGEDAILETGGMCFHSFIAFAQQGKGEERMSGVWVVLGYADCFCEAA